MSEVNSPQHYIGRSGMEAIDVIREFRSDSDYLAGLDFNLLKYAIRYQDKGNPLQDLQKMRYYLERLIEVYSKDQNGISSSH